MTWTIRDIVLPIDPSEVKKRTIRLQQPVAVSGDFPDPSINQPTKFELQIKGFIWPRVLAQQLDEATKNAETENIVVSVSEETGDSVWLSGEYAVTTSEVGRDRPLYDAITGAEVYEYNITFAKYADSGSNQSSDQAGPAGDEDTGFFSIQSLGFDANGDGDIDLDDIFNWFNSIVTFGATG